LVTPVTRRNHGGLEFARTKSPFPEAFVAHGIANDMPIRRKVATSTREAGYGFRYCRVQEVKMSRPARIPDRGDVPPAVVARRLGLSLPDFETRRSELFEREFPQPDPTTGNYAMEAVDRWRLSRYKRLFPELLAAPAAIDAAAVFEERMRRFDG